KELTLVPNDRPTPPVEIAGPQWQSRAIFTTSRVTEGFSMAIYQLGDLKPVIPASCYIAEEAIVIGAVTLGERVTILPGAAVRGDNDPIVIGDDSNVQDHAVLHTDLGCPLTIGKGVSIGHQVMLHGCTIGDGSLIGIAAVVLNSSMIGKDCLVGAGAVVTENKPFPDRSVIFGSPAKAVREVNEDNIARLRFSADAYMQLGALYRRELKRIG